MIAAIAPPDDIPATYTRPSATLYSSVIWRVIPATSEGSRGTGHEKRVLLGERLHPGSGGDVVGVLRTTVEQHDQGHFLPYVAAGDVQPVRTGPGLIGVGALDEAAPCRNNSRIGLSFFRAGHSAGQAGKPPGHVQGHAVRHS